MSEETLDLKVSIIEDPVLSDQLADRCGLVRTTLVPGCFLSWRTYGGQVRTDADNPGSQLSLSRRKFGGQVRRGADRCRQVCFLGVFLSWPTFGRDLRTVADSYGQVWFLGFLSCRTFGGQVRGQVRTGVDRCGKVMFLGVT